MEYTHACIHTCMHAYKQTNKQTWNTYKHACIHIHMHEYRHAHMSCDIYTMLATIHAYTYIQTYQHSTNIMHSIFQSSFFGLGFVRADSFLFPFFLKLNGRSANGRTLRCVLRRSLYFAEVTFFCVFALEISVKIWALGIWKSNFAFFKRYFSVGCLHMYVPIYIFTYICTCKSSHMHICTFTHTCIYTHSRTHTHTHTPKYTHIHGAR